MTTDRRWKLLQKRPSWPVMCVCIQLSWSKHSRRTGTKLRAPQAKLIYTHAASSPIAIVVQRQATLLTLMCSSRAERKESRDVCGHTAIPSAWLILTDNVSGFCTRRGLSCKEISVNMNQRFANAETHHREVLNYCYEELLVKVFISFLSQPSRDCLGSIRVFSV